MSRTSTDLTTHLVRWFELKPAFDGKTFLRAEVRGIVLSQVFHNGAFTCMVVDANGRVWIKPATDLFMVYPPVSHPRNGQNTEPKQQTIQATQTHP